MVNIKLGNKVFNNIEEITLNTVEGEEVVFVLKNSGGEDDSLSEAGIYSYPENTLLMSWDEALNSGIVSLDELGGMYGVRLTVLNLKGFELVTVVIPEGIGEIGYGVMGYANEKENLCAISLPVSLKHIDYQGNGDWSDESVERLYANFKYAGTIEQWGSVALTPDGWKVTAKNTITITCSDGVLEIPVPVV